MANNFLDTLDPKEKQVVQNRMDTLVKLLREWGQEYSIRPDRIPMIALTTAVVLPKIPVFDALTWSKTITWMFTIDDDLQMFTPDDLWHKADQWYSIARTWPASNLNDNDRLTRIVTDVTRDLSTSHTIFEPLREYWASRLHKYAMAVAQDTSYSFMHRSHGVWPPLDEYIRTGIHSIGYPTLGAMAMIFHKDISVLNHLKHINQVVKYASAALRLFNDVASFDREVQTHEKNSISIVHQAMLGKRPDADIFAAKRYVLRLAESYVQKCYGLVKKSGTDSGQIEKATCRLVALHAHFYGYTEQDFHTTSLAETYQMLRQCSV